jgi:hypothetical protein
MGEDLKAELGIFIENMQAARRLFAMLADEVRVLQEPLKMRAHLLAALRSGIAGEDGTTIRNELVELISHCGYSLKIAPRSVIGAFSRIVTAGASPLGEPI